MSILEYPLRHKAVMSFKSWVGGSGEVAVQVSNIGI